MSSDKKTSLRVLYTINASPQYILAKSHTRVPVSVIPATEDSGSHNTLDAPQSQPFYANVLLKTCLNTIRRSSPELTQDSNRDFSIYVLDPLESNSAPAPVQISNADGGSSSSNNSAPAAEQPRGVAVGLGLMSWALAADDSDAMTVVGTLVKQTNGQEALEVIFALRETVAMQKPTWNVQPGSSQGSSSQESAGYSVVDAVQSQGCLPSSQASISSATQPLASTSMQTRSSTADLTRETLASIQMRAKAKIKPPKPPKPVKQSTIPVTESDKLMNADTYIGPLKKKGRPKTTGLESKPAAIRTNATASVSTSSASQPKEFIVIDGSDSDGAAPTPTTATFSTLSKTDQRGSQDPAKKKRSTQHPTSAPFTTEPLVRRTPNSDPSASQVQVKVEQREEPSLLDILAYLSSTPSSESNTQNTAILAALSTIDSSNSEGKSSDANAPNPALVSALKQLLSVCAQPPANAEPVPSAPTNPVNPEPTKIHHHSSSTLQDDGIVILDKENVNPIAYRKRANKDSQAFKVLDPSSAPASSSSGNTFSTQSSHQDRHVQSLGPSARSNETLPTKAPFKEPGLGSSSAKVVRKRTLSDFMDERENGRSKGKGKERERIEKRDGHRHVHSQRVPKTPVTDALRHYPRLLAFNHPRTEQSSSYYREPLESMAMTSPARGRPDFDEKPLELESSVTSGSGSQSSSNKCQSSSPTRPLRVSASSPVRGTQHEARRKYVVPEWARTSTSTQPRLSEEAQRALDEAEEKKKQERNAARRRLPSMQARSKNKNVGTVSKADAKGNLPVKPLAPPPPKFDAAQGPITASSDRPMIAAANITFPFISSTRSSSPPPQPNAIPTTPKTPCRGGQLPRATPGGENDSLFTPIMGSGSLFGSAHSYSLRTPLLPSVLTSPLGNRKKAKLSPARSSLTGKPFSIPGSWINSSSAPASSDSKNMEEVAPSKSLDRELEDALDDLECPPSSLPIASSDIDVNESQPQTSGDADLDDGEQLPIRQHWAGLPPSSPPAPSSPMLIPDSADNDIPTDDEMDDLPIATSDSETDTEMTSCDTDHTTSPDAQSPAYLNDNSHEDFSAFFTQTDFSASSEHTNSSDLFEQFTTLNDQHSDMFPSMGEINMDPEMEAMFQDGLDNIDFTEFWETFKPLVNDSTQASQGLSDQNGGGGFDAGHGDSLASFGEIDHIKLADDMQSLLSGCLM